jgi:hypothetical protein
MVVGYGDILSLGLDKGDKSKIKIRKFSLSTSSVD